MNLEVYNRVNWKEPYNSSGRNKHQKSLSGMYSKWASLTSKVYGRSCCENLEEKSVLCKFSAAGGKQLTVIIVKQLASSLAITQAAEPSNLTTEKEILWCMEVICYGLTLPLTEHDIVRDCVHVYCEWLSALCPTPKICVPIPICKDPNFFARKIIAHFLNLFMPRNGEGCDVINKQAVLCHRVLRTLQQLTQTSNNIENDTWQTMLLFLLTINDTLLAPPTIKDDVGDQLCERVLSVLLEVWLIACIKCYPSPPLWKTLREMAINWRHRTALIEQWNRINLTLTSRILEIMYGMSFPQLKIAGDEDLQSTVNNMTEECVVQTWFRMLHTIGNPVDLCRSNVISQTPQFLQYAITSDNPSDHPCLSVLPLNFYKAIKGIASLVDAFLGTPVFIQWEDYPYTNIPLFGCGVLSSSSEYCSPTPPTRRRLAKSFSVTSSKSTHQKSTLMGLTTSRSNALATANAAGGSPSFVSSSLSYMSHYGPNNRNALLSPLRPKCNSILHLFGEWLFEASYNSEVPRLISSSTSGGTVYGISQMANWPVGETGSVSSSGSISSFLLRKGSSSQPNSLTTDSSDPDTGSSTPQATSLSAVGSVFHDKFLCGRAEAVGTLCRIFCAKKTGEEILPIYLSRFYMIIQQSLRIKEYGECDEVMASVLLNSAEIFSIDLDGVLLLAPYFVEALEIVLPDRNLKFNENSTAMLSMNNIASALTNSVNIPSYSSAIPSCGIASGSTGTGASNSSLMLNSAAAAPAMISTASSNSSCISSSVSFPSATIMNMSSSSLSTMSGAEVNTDSSLNLGVDDSSVTLTPATALMMSNAVSGSVCSMMSTPPSIVPLVELRKACIYLLLSVLPLPLHFQNLPLKEFGNIGYRINFSGSGNLTFGQLKPRLVNLLINALQCETDSCNTHLLLGGLLFAVQDSVLCEQNNTFVTYHGDLQNDLPSSLVASDSVNCLFIRSVHLVCHRLITAWKIDLNVSLAALEFLTSMARIKLRDLDILECKRAVKWLCDFIVHQCGRPPPAHSKDLHSSIVAAFQCTSNWLISHPRLLDDKECLNTLLEVVELGISGTKSQGKRSEPIRMKDEKELKPVSMRVRDAAEALLTIILEQTGELGSSSILCLLDELILVKQCSTSTLNSNNKDPFTYEEAVSKFHYFLFENNVMIAFLQESLGNDQDPQPTITLLIRNSFGRYAWTLQLRHLPRHRSATKQNYGNLLTATTGRPISMAETSTLPIVQQRYFPESINRIESYKVDKSIPSLEDISDEASNEKLESLIDQQYQAEIDTSQTSTESFKECNPPPTCNEFYTARMFFSHLGLLSKYRSNNNKQEESGLLVALDNNRDGFASELKNLDEITSKTCDTCHIFYVKSGQKRYSDILENTMSRSSVSINFIELLYSLGWPVRVDQHNGWTGHVSTSYKISRGNASKAKRVSSKFDSNVEEELEDGVCLYDGSERVLYWCDAISEVAFVVPSLRQQSLSGPNITSWYERGGSTSSDTAVQEKIGAANNQSTIEKTKGSSIDSNSSLDNKPSGVFAKRKLNLVTVVMLVWLESFEDHAHFPINELFPYTNTGPEGNIKVDMQRDIYVIFIQAMQNGLFRVKLQGPVNKINIATPLVDGMVISRRTAGQLIRQTVLNICKRRRLDSDSYQLPHVRRRLKLQEIKERFESKMEPPELLTYLLKNC